MSEYAKPATEAQKEQAVMQATVWDMVASICGENAERRTDINRDLMKTLATFALIVGGEYRRVANKGEIEP
jgi:hypothetical protein